MSGGGSAAAPRAGSRAAHPGTRDPSDLEDLLAGQPLVTLEAAAESMDGLEFFRGTRQATETFDFQRARASVRECRDWAQGPLAGDALQARIALQERLGERAARESGVDYGVEGLAAIRAWTGSPMCYVLSTALRSTAGQELDPVKPYALLFLSALRALPPPFLYEGTLYRAQHGVLEGVEWSRDKPKVDNDEDVLYHFYAPTSFSTDQETVRAFKPCSDDEYFDNEPRTFMTIYGAVGYKLQALSAHPEEREVLVEPVCSCTITRMQRFEGKEEEFPGEQTGPLDGLDLIEFRVKPGPRYALCAQMLVFTAQMLVCTAQTLVCALFSSMGSC